MSEAKMQRDMYANNVFSETADPHRPGTAQSRAKAAEMSGHNVFSDGTGFVAGEDTRPRNRGHRRLKILFLQILTQKC
jgi:hypothetical protein